MSTENDAAAAAAPASKPIDVDALKREMLAQTQELLRQEREEAAKALKAQKDAADAEIARLKAEVEGKVSLPKPEPAKAPTIEELAAELALLKAAKASPAPAAVDVDALKREAQEAALKEIRLELFREQRQRAINEAKLPAPLAKLVQGKTMEEVSASIAELKGALDSVAKDAAERRADELKALLPKEAKPLETAAPIKRMSREKGGLASLLEAESRALDAAKAALFKGRV